MVVYALFVAVSMWFAMVIVRWHTAIVCKDCGKSFVIATNLHCVWYKKRLVRVGAVH